MKRLLSILAGLFLCVSVWAQSPEYEALASKMDEYLAAIVGESAPFQESECDYLISSCRDSLVRQFVALRLYDHYLNSKILGDDAVAVHIAKEWFLSGKVPMADEMDLTNAKVYVMFNEQSLAGAVAPEMLMQTPSGADLSVPSQGSWSVLYFYDTGCSTCRLETARLSRLLGQKLYPVVVYAIYTGSDEAAWKEYRATHLDYPEVIHLWDPANVSDYPLKYGVLQTPQMVLVNPDGVVEGRGLDTPALTLLLGRAFDNEAYVYGQRPQMEMFGKIFSAYDPVTASTVMEVAGYLTERTLGEGDADSYRNLIGDLLYYLVSKREGEYRDGAVQMAEKYILKTEGIWTSPEDSAKVVSLADHLSRMYARTPVGERLPSMKVHATLLKKGGLFCKGRKEGVFDLSASKVDYLVFHTKRCGRCEHTLEAAESMVAGNRSLRILLVDLDFLTVEHPDESRALLDTFDLTAMPKVLELDRDGTVLRRYVEL